MTVAGTGAVTITYNDGGTGGDLIFFPGAKLDFWDTSSSLIVERESYLLVSALRPLATAIAADATGRYALATDYDAAADGTYRSSPIREVEGIVEGLGHVVAHLRIRNREQGSLGLFKHVRQQGEVRDIGITAAEITSAPEFGGMLVGLNDGDIQNSYAVGDISGAINPMGSQLGGLMGYNGTRGRIIHSYVAGSVSSTGEGTEAGGLVGENDGAIIGSFASGNVGGSFAGGLASLNNGSVSESYANVTVRDTLGAPDGRVAGLIAMNYGSIINSYATGDIYATDSDEHAGGLVGLNNGGTISSAFASGSVSGGEYVGGLVALNVGDLTNTYATGPVSTADSIGGIIGGLVGWSSGGHISLSYSTGAVLGGKSSICRRVDRPN